MRRILTLLTLSLGLLAGCRAQTMTSLPAMPNAYVDSNTITFAVQPAHAQQTYKMKLAQLARYINSSGAVGLAAGSGCYIDHTGARDSVKFGGYLSFSTVLETRDWTLGLGDWYSIAHNQGIMIGQGRNDAPFTGVWARTPGGRFVAGDYLNEGNGRAFTIDDSLGFYNFNKLRNNLAGDSVLSTDTGGNVRLVQSAFVDNGAVVRERDTLRRVGIGTTAPGYSLHVSGSTFLSKKLPNGMYMQMIMDSDIKGYPVNAAACQYGTLDGVNASFWDIGDYRRIGGGPFHYDLGHANTYTGRTHVVEGDSTYLRIYAQDHYGGHSLATYFDYNGVGIGTSTPAAALDVRGGIYATGPDSMVYNVGRQRLTIQNRYSSGHSGHQNIGFKVIFSPDTTVTDGGTATFLVGTNTQDFDEPDTIMVEMLAQNADGTGANVAVCGNQTSVYTMTGAGSGAMKIKQQAGEWVVYDDAQTDTLVRIRATDNKLQYKDGSQATGRVLGSDAYGNATWQATAPSHTPSGSADSYGSEGDVVHDSSYLYVKTSAGWKRTALSTF